MSHSFLRSHASRLALSVLIGALAAQSAAAQVETGSLEVRVVAAESSRSLAGVQVTLTPRDGDAKVVVSQDAGIAEFSGLPPGLYAVSASGEGRVTAVEPSIRVVPRRTTPLLIELREREELEPVTVTARALQVESSLGVTASILNREELFLAVGAGSDVPRALDGLPGLASTGEFASYSVRGRSPRDNLIFVDGIPFDRVVHFDQTLGEDEDIGGGGRYSIFAPNSVASAEFSPGGWSAAYGGRSGSLLLLDLVGGSPTPTASLRVDIAGVELAYEGPSGLRDDTTVYFNARQFDFGRVFEEIEELDIGDPELTDVVFKSVTQLDADNTLEFLAIVAPEEYTRDAENVFYSPDFEDVSLIDSEQDTGLFGVTWRRLGDAGDWTHRLFYRYNDKTTSEGEAYPDLVPPETPPEEIPVREDLLTVGEDETEIGLRSDWSKQNRLGTIRAGLHVSQLDVDYSTVLREDWDRFVYRSTDPRPPGQQYIVLTPPDIDSTYQAKEMLAAAYGEQSFDMGRWQLDVGARYDYDGFAEESLFSPRFAAAFEANATTRFTGTAGVFYQSPRYLVRAANPDNFTLKNERAVHVSVGMEKQLGSLWSVLVEPYYQWLDDLVVAEGRTTARASNSGKGSNAGVDVVLTRAFDNGWFANATYSFNDARVEDGDGTPSYDADFNREHFFTIGGSWEITPRWQVGARWKYGTGQPTDDFIIHEDVLGPGQPLRYSKELTTKNALRLDDYHSLNIRVDYRRTLGPVDVVAFVDIINVYAGPGQTEQEFDPRRGVNVVEEGEAFPILGLIFERSW